MIMKDIRRLAMEVHDADITRKNFSFSLCDGLLRAAGLVEEYEKKMAEYGGKTDADFEDGTGVQFWKDNDLYKLADDACFKLNIARHGQAALFVNGEYWRNMMDEILDDDVWVKVAEAIGADKSIGGDGTVKGEKERLSAIVDFEVYSLFNVFVEA